MKRRLGRVARAAAVGAIATVAGTIVWLAWPVPPSLLARANGEGISIEDRHGLVLRSTRAADGSQLRWLSFAELDPDLINAFVAVEDHRFWEHRGVDPRAVARALRDNLRAGHVRSGASTITMQLARLLAPAERTWGGKATQALWALRLELHLDKQQILEQYLNRVQLGQATIGVGAASALYFDASASDVSMAQAATLAGLTHAPSRDNPYVSPKRARARRQYALARMRRLGFALPIDVARASDEPLIAPRRAAPFLAPHFTTRVLAWAATDSGAGQREVRTSLDVDLQRALESEVRHTVDLLRDRGVEHAAAVVLDNRTGEVLAWVGSPDFWASADGQTDMVASARQPGSALKPFLYALALERGFTAATVLPDVPHAYPTATGPYTPRNYDRRFRGPVRAREALASSYNVPAVELAARVGTGSLLHTLHLAGFESLRKPADYYGLGLALGNGDVTLIELANGYRALANGGEWRPWTWHLDHASPGAAHHADARRIASPVASAIVLDMLSDATARIPGFGVSTPFDFPFPVAAKTGTSRHFTDNWAVGTTRRFTVAVWAGNFSGRPMQGVSGVTGAGPLLHRSVMAVARVLDPGALTTPAEAGAVSERVCRLSGLRATTRCAQLTEWFVAGTEPKSDDDWERDGRVVLPEEFASWASQGFGTASEDVAIGSVREGTQPAFAAAAQGVERERALADSARARDAKRFHVASPLNGDRYAIPAGVEAEYATIPLRAAGATGSLRWIVDGTPFGGTRWPLRLGRHHFRVESSAGEVAEADVVVER